MYYPPRVRALVYGYGATASAQPKQDGALGIDQCNPSVDRENSVLILYVSVLALT